MVRLPQLVAVGDSTGGDQEAPRLAGGKERGARAPLWQAKAPACSMFSSNSCPWKTHEGDALVAVVCRSMTRLSRGAGGHACRPWQFAVGGWEGLQLPRFFWRPAAQGSERLRHGPRRAGGRDLIVLGIAREAPWPGSILV